MKTLIMETLQFDFGKAVEAHPRGVEGFEESFFGGEDAGECRGVETATFPKLLFGLA